MRDEVKKKRVLRACDTCRVKKAKCDGAKPCGRCQADNQVCTYAHRRKHSERVFSNDYVELLESKLQTVLKSFMLLINEIGEGNDCARYVDGPTASIATVIEKLSDELKRMKDTSDMDDKVTRLIESSKLLPRSAVESDDDNASPASIPDVKPRPRRGRPPKSQTHAVYSPIARPAAPLPPRIKEEEPPVLMKDEELDNTKNSLIMNWQPPAPFDNYRPFEDSFPHYENLDLESQYAENLVLNDELLSTTPPAQDQVPEFGHPVEYDLPMEDFGSTYQFCPELTRSISVEM